MKKKYDQEIADVVRVSNDKYNNMMVEQLCLHEELKKEYEKKCKQIRDDTEDSVRKEYEKKLNQLSASLGGDKQEALMALKREMEEKIQAQRDDMMKKIENLLNEVRARTEENDQLKSDINRLHDQAAVISAGHKKEIDDYKRQKSELEKASGEAKGGAEMRTTQLMSEIEKLKQEIEANKIFMTQSNAKVAEKEDEVKRLTVQLQEQISTGGTLEASVDSLKKEITRLSNEIDRQNQTGASLETTLKVPTTLFTHLFIS